MSTKPQPKKKTGPKPKPKEQLTVRVPVRLAPDLKAKIAAWVQVEKDAKRLPFAYSVSKFIADAAAAHLARLSK
jgi:hypothetical protein